MKKLFLFLTLLIAGITANAQFTPYNNLNYMKLLKTPPNGLPKDSVLVYDSSDQFVKMRPTSTLVPEHNSLSGLQGGDATDRIHLTAAQLDKVEGSEQISNKSSSYTASSTTTYANTKALVDGLLTKENTFSKNTGFNKPFGTSLGTVSEGNHIHNYLDLTGLPQLKKDAFIFSGSKIFTLTQTSTNILSVVVDGKDYYDVGTNIQYRMNTSTELEILEELTVGEDVNVVVTYNYAGSGAISSQDYLTKEESYDKVGVLELGTLVNGRYTNIKTEDTNSSYKKTGLIEVTGGSVVNSNTAFNANTKNIQYDEFLQPLGFLTLPAGTDVALHRLCKYVAFSDLIAGMTGKVITVKEYFNPEFNKGVEKIANDLTLDGSDNLFNYQEITLGNTSSVDGSIVELGANSYYTPMIKLRKQGNLVVKNIINPSFFNSITYYNSAGGFISRTAFTIADGSIKTSALEGGSFYRVLDVPLGAAYFRYVTQYRSDNTITDLQKLYILEIDAYKSSLMTSSSLTKYGNDLNTNVIRDVIKTEKIINTSLFNKVVVRNGDSLTANNSGEGSWGVWFNGAFSPKASYAMASGGATLTDTRNAFGQDYLLTSENTLIQQCEQYIKSVNDGVRLPPDLFIIAGGTNDFDLGRYTTQADMAGLPYDEYMEGNYMTVSPTFNTLKALTTVNRGKIAGAVRYIAERIFSLYPNCVVMVWTPPQSTLHNQLNAQRVVRDIKWMANRMNLPVIDCWNEGGMPMTSDYGTSHYWLSDNVHPFSVSGQTIGSQRLGRFIVNEILKKYIPNAPISGITE